MAIWKVSDNPEVILTQWQVYELNDGSRHFVGYNSMNYEGRVSSSIKEFDKEKMIGITRSGRIYKLEGPNGCNGDAQYVWNSWKIINNISECNEVTKEYIKEE